MTGAGGVVAEPATDDVAARAGRAPDTVAIRTVRRLAQPRRVALWVLFILGYGFLDRAGQVVTGQVGGGTAWDLAAGLAFALLLLEGPIAIPVVALADFADGFLMPGPHPALLSSLAAALDISVSYGLATWWLRRAGVRRLQSQADLVRLALAAIAGALAHAAADLALLGRWSSVAADPWASTLPLAWTGSLVGILVIAPLVMLPPAEGRPSRQALIEAAIMGLLLAAALSLTLPTQPRDPLGYFYLLFLPQIWAAVRFGVRGAVFGNLVVQVGLAAYFLTGVHLTDLMFAFEFKFLALVATVLFLGCAVTERRGLEAALRRRQEELARVSRLSLAGEVAGALAHQLNQPLLAAMAFTRSAQRLLARPEDANPRPDYRAASEAMDEAVAQAERAGGIVRSLREFIGRSTPTRVTLAFDALLRETAQLVAPACVKAGARLEIVIDHPLPQAYADGVQTQQVLINLVQNALDALSASPGDRRVTLAARRADGFIEAEVRDTGPGLSPAMAAQLFEPFASDKRGGMGLGLAVSLGLVEAQGGRLWLAENQPGRCSFRFTVPAAQRSFAPRRGAGRNGARGT